VAGARDSFSHSRSMPIATGSIDRDSLMTSSWIRKARWKRIAMRWRSGERVMWCATHGVGSFRSTPRRWERGPVSDSSVARCGGPIGISSDHNDGNQIVQGPLIGDHSADDGRIGECGNLRFIGPRYDRLRLPHRALGMNPRTGVNGLMADRAAQPSRDRRVKMLGIHPVSSGGRGRGANPSVSTGRRLEIFAVIREAAGEFARGPPRCGLRHVVRPVVDQ